MNKIESFNGLRFIFALMIVWCHVMYNMPSGNFAVCGFLVMSGFLIGLRSPLKNSNYDWNKVLSSFRRIYPIYMITIILYLIIQYTVLDLPFFDGIISLLAHSLLIQNWLPYNYVHPLNSPSWYLSVYFFVLIVYVLLNKLSKRYDSKVILSLLSTALFIVFIIGLIFYTEAEEQLYYFYFFAPIRLIDFSSGLLLAHFARKSLFANSSRALIFQCISILLVILSFILRGTLNMPSWLSCQIIYIPIVMLLLYSFANNTGVPTIIDKLLSSKIMTFGGNISMQIFIYHSFFARIFFHTQNNEPVIGNYIVVVIASIVVSVLSHRYVEPFMDKVFSKCLNRCTTNTTNIVR